MRFWLAFIPLFVAFDVVGLLPVYWALAQGLPSHQRRQAVHHAVLVAFFVAWVFLVVSKSAFLILGISMADVMIAGGLILFVLALSDLLRPDGAPHRVHRPGLDVVQGKTSYGSAEAIGVVPLGVPLIVGPAVLTTILLLRERYGVWATMGALSLNILVTWVVLQATDRLIERLGREGTRVISKVSNLVLAAFAVMLVRQGLMTFLQR